MHYKYAGTLKNKLYFYEAHVISVYDGDTFTARIDLGFNVAVEHIFRLSGVDTPEIRGEERKQGVLVRDVVREMILNKNVFIETIHDKKGKYGRYLAIVWYPQKSRYYCLNEFLLEKNMATPY